jgi:subtilase family serine protease
MRLFLLVINIFHVIIGSTFEVPVYVALHQNNINILQDHLTDISNPLSVNYGKWMKRDEINKLVHPPENHQNIVVEWLKTYNIHKLQNNGDSITFSTNGNIIMKMFNITNDRVDTSRFVNYTIPIHLRKYIEFVEMSSTKMKRKIKQNYTDFDSQTDDRYFGREPLLALYNVPPSNLQGNVSGALIEYQNNGGFLNMDLNIQQFINDQNVQNASKIVGGNIDIDVESELDVQLMSQASDGIEMWFWTSPYWLYSFAVDFYNSEHIPDIISMSWGWSERDQCDIMDCVNITSQQYVERVNNEYLKIALRGVTIVVSSGDAGAPGRTNEGCNIRQPINPVFPGSSPYVTSAGATFVSIDNTTRNYTTPLCLIDGCITSSNEKSIRYDSVGWTAGGGFNLYNNKTPTWQKKEVDSYLQSGIPLPSKENVNYNGRAYPDISAIGHSCPTIIDGQLGGVDGTSCSAPVVAGLLSIINNALWKYHHLKLGFANPLLYYMYEKCPECFQDVTDGYNWCTEETCCSNKTEFGFEATKGYDPVSGLGTLHVKNILSFIKKLY